MSHTILFLAANPSGTNPLALDREARAIHGELERSGFRDLFDLETRWAAEPLDLLRELRKLRPTVVHYSGHGGQDGHGGQGGLFFQAPDGRAQLVSTAALAETFGAAGSSVRVVVLSSCYSEAQAEALLAHVDCVVGMGSSIHADAAKSFAIGFYGGLGERESIAAAYKQGCAAISLMGLRDSDRPQLKVRSRVDASQIILAEPSEASPSPHTPSAQKVDVPALHRKIVAQFSREEIALLCMELEEKLRADGLDESISIDIVGGQSTPEIARNLIAHLQRRGLLSYLVELVREHRPQDVPPQLTAQDVPPKSPTTSSGSTASIANPISGGPMLAVSASHSPGAQIIVPGAVSPEPRVFYSLQEARERLQQEEPFLARSASVEFRGRQVEIDRVLAFAASKKLFLVIHGAGGVGKTRLLVEGGNALMEAEWQVLWTNVATLTTGASWGDALVPERRTVVLVDEPDDEQVLRLLAEQLGSRVGRAAQWKVIVAVRSPKDPVLRYLLGPKLSTHVDRLPVDPLPLDAATAVCEELLATGSLASRGMEWRKEVAKKLTTRFARHPIWLTLAVHLLEVHGDANRIPENAVALAECYLVEIIDQQASDNPELVRSLLQWIALIGTVNRENESTLRLIGEGSGVDAPTSVLAMIARLIQRRALIQRGANSRLVELKPDVLRDYVLRSWLAVPVGFGDVPFRPSEHVVELMGNCSSAIANGGLSDAGMAILTSVARTELLFRLDDTPVPLLDPFFASLRESIPTLSVSPRIALAKALIGIAGFRIRDTVEVIKLLRTSATASEETKTIFGRRELGHDDVVLSLAWPLYHAAMSAQFFEDRVEILKELIALVEAESEIATRRKGGLPNDGKRASALIPRTLEGGPHFWSEFDDAVEALASQTLDRLAASAPTKQQVDALQALIYPAVALERHQSWSAENSLVLRKHLITEAHQGWTTRTRILDKAKALLANDAVPHDSHIVLWKILVEAHRQANYVALHGPDTFKVLVRNQFIDELRWAHAVLQKRSAELDEIRAARDLWDWHVRFEKDASVKAEAEKLENLYVANDLAGEFKPFMEFDSVEAVQRRAEEKAAQLVASGKGAIEAFVERSIRFTSDNERFPAVLGIANELGARAGKDSAIRDFVDETLQSPVEAKRLEFALSIASRWFDECRREHGDVLALARSLQTLCADARTRIRLLLALYGLTPPKLRGQKVSAEELAYIRSHAALFLSQRMTPAFIGLISWTLVQEWAEYKHLVESSLGELNEPERTHAVAALIQGIFWTVYKRDKSEFPSDLNVWLLDQVIRASDLGGNLEWHLGQVIEVLGQVPLPWISKALELRAHLEASGTGEGLDFGSSLSDYVQPIDIAQQNDPKVIAVVDELLNLADDDGSVGYRLPDILHSIDPNGYVVATRVAAQIKREPEHVGRFTRLARSYVINTLGWRSVAKAALEVAASIPSADERKLIYGSLGNPGIRSWSGTPGEVPSVFISAVERARDYRDREVDEHFRPFWEWYVAAAEAELKHQEELAKEERGE